MKIAINNPDVEQTKTSGSYELNYYSVAPVYPSFELARECCICNNSFHIESPNEVRIICPECIRKLNTTQQCVREQYVPDIGVGDIGEVANCCGSVLDCLPYTKALRSTLGIDVGIS